MFPHRLPLHHRPSSDPSFVAEGLTGLQGNVCIKDKRHECVVADEKEFPPPPAAAAAALNYKLHDRCSRFTKVTVVSLVSLGAAENTEQ